MKKIILTIILVFGLMSFSYAATMTCNEDGCSGASNNLEGFKTSKNVTLVANTVVQSYAAVSSHLNGDKVYGSSSDSPVIKWTTKTKGTAYTTAPSASDSSAFSSWNDL